MRPRRVAVEPRRRRAERARHARDASLGYGERKGALHEERDRAVGDGLRRVVVAVEPRARPAREAGTGTHAAAVFGDEGDFDVGVVHAFHDVETGEQLVPPHACASSRLFDHPTPVRVPVALDAIGSGTRADRVVRHRGRPPHGAGGTRSAPSACCMIWENAGAATVPPKMALLGSSSTTMAAIRGSFAGANPTNDATYR